jgi:hypothetical protein
VLVIDDWLMAPPTKIIENVWGFASSPSKNLINESARPNSSYGGCGLAPLLPQSQGFGKEQV